MWKGCQDYCIEYFDKHVVVLRNARTVVQPMTPEIARALIEEGNARRWLTERQQPLFLSPDRDYIDLRVLAESERA